jgi:hypothetical protein
MFLNLFRRPPKARHMKKGWGAFSKVPDHHRNDWPELLQKMGYCPEVSCGEQCENERSPHDDFQFKWAILDIGGLHLNMCCSWEPKRGCYVLCFQNLFERPSEEVVLVARQIQNRLQDYGFDVVAAVPPW